MAFKQQSTIKLKCRLNIHLKLALSQQTAEKAQNKDRQQPMDMHTTVSSAMVSMTPIVTSVAINSTAHLVPAATYTGTMFPAVEQIARPATMFTGLGQQEAQHSTYSALTTNTITQKSHESFAQLQLELLEEERKIEQKYLQKKYEILSQGGSLIGINRSTATPTSSQLAARQVIPKDLPIFSGNPDDWPLFISNYENSTNIAGYTDAENLMRLQKCLKGRDRK